MKKFVNLGLFMLFGTGGVFAQTDKTTTAKIVAEKTFVFIANTANPLNSNDINNILRQMPGNVSGGNINLSGSNYDVRINADSLVAYLPYYGRSFSAPLNPDENGYKFKSKSFNFTTTPTKKGGWEILIVTKDVKDNPRLSFSISQNGYVSLSIISNNKQSISYNGYLAENKSTEN